MSARHDLVERSAPFLPPDSEIRQAFICQTAPSFAFFIITYLTGLWVHRRFHPQIAAADHEAGFTQGTDP